MTQTPETQARRIQRKRTKGWKMPPNTVYVGRPTKWGNPYFLVPMIGSNEEKRRAREEVVANFRAWILANQQSAERFRKPIHELRGKDLACWCPLDQPCHADVLLEIANSEEISQCQRVNAARNSSRKCGLQFGRKAQRRSTRFG